MSTLFGDGAGASMVGRREAYIRVRSRRAKLTAGGRPASPLGSVIRAPVDIETGHYQLSRRMRQPFGKRQVFEARGAEQLQIAAVRRRPFFSM